MADTIETVEGEILSLAQLESQLEQKRTELAAADDRIAQFFELERKVKETSKELSARIIEGMVAIGKKTLEGSYGKITVVETPKYKVDKDELPDEFFKLQPDLKKIGAYVALTNEAPKGVEPYYSRSLRKTFKKES